MFGKNDPVYLAACDEYNEEKLTALLSEAIGQLNASKLFEGKRVVVKPNLVRKMDPEKGGTTHPVMLSALVGLLYRLGASSVLIAESPGGIYNSQRLRATYDGCGITEAADKSGAELNFDCAYGEQNAPNGKKSKVFEVIDPIAHAEVIVNLCKMKSHGLLTQSGAAKNFFGVIPGVLKVEMHARFPEPRDFSGMLCDLNEMLHEGREILHICDGIIAMEGNGPTGGTPRKAGVVLVSRNPFNLDLAAAKIMNMEGRSELASEAIERSWSPENADGVSYTARKPDDFILSDFVLPDSSKSSTLKKLLTFGDGRFAHLIEPRPKINKKNCRGCGECMRNCPQKTISMVEGKNGKKRAQINKKNCIKCYCCQEMCPFDGVKIKKNPIVKLVNRL